MNPFLVFGFCVGLVSIWLAIALWATRQKKFEERPSRESDKAKKMGTKEKRDFYRKVLIENGWIPVIDFGVIPKGMGSRMLIVYHSGPPYSRELCDYYYHPEKIAPVPIEIALLDYEWRG